MTQNADYVGQCEGTGKPVYLDYGGPGVIIPRCPMCRQVVQTSMAYALMTPPHNASSGTP